LATLNGTHVTLGRKQDLLARYPLGPDDERIAHRQRTTPLKP
jgi:hypothetical protein